MHCLLGCMGFLAPRFVIVLLVLFLGQPVIQMLFPAYEERRAILSDLLVPLLDEED